MQLYTKLVAEASSGTPINGPDFEPMPFPPNILETLHSLVDFLRTLPLPPTHPTHPAAPAIQAALKEAQKGYGDMRGAWSKKCLEVYGKRVVERAGTVDGIVTGREFATFLDNIMNVADVSNAKFTRKGSDSPTPVCQAEYALLLTLAPLTAPASINSTYTTLLNPLCTLFSSTLSSLSSLIKRDLSKYTPMALSLYSYLSAEQERWDQTMVRRAGRRENELKDGLQSMRATCQRSFPEFLADIKLAANSSRGELSTGVIDTTMSVRGGAVWC